jgi:microcystin degradation protein MlrC
MAAHLAFAESIADDIWQRRFEVLNDYMSVEAAAATCLAHDGKGGPIVVADYADNPGGGAYGDGTNLLKALLDAGVSRACFGPMIDPEAAATLQRYKPGGTVTLAVGGKTDPAMGGAPLILTGTLKLISNGHYVGDGPMIGGLKKSYGPTAVFAVGGIDILVVSLSAQLLDRQQFEAFGIMLADKSVIALKSMQHFRAAFQPIAAKVIVCDSGALCTPDPRRLPYRNATHPVFPLDGFVKTEGGEAIST